MSKVGNKSLAALSLVVMSIYLFVTAPPPLDLEPNSPQSTVPIELVFDILNNENSAFRRIYTNKIVGPAIQQGLKFDEHWLNKGAQTGPLPAVALRGTALRLDRINKELSLFLGAKEAINRGNLFKGAQKTRFEDILATKKQVFYFDEGQQIYSAMYPDVAVGTPCVECHNNHDKSTFDQWELGMIMGATTWSHPKESLTIKETLQTIKDLRLSLRETYQAYLNRAKRFNNPPEIGDKWPNECFCIPSADNMMSAQENAASPTTMTLLTTVTLD